MKCDFISSILLCDSEKKKVRNVSSKAASAFALIWALPALSPEANSVFGNNCRLKFPSLIFVQNYLGPATLDWFGVDLSNVDRHLFLDTLIERNKCLG